jgi:hypothetical protein
VCHCDRPAWEGPMRSNVRHEICAPRSRQRTGTVDRSDLMGSLPELDDSIQPPFGDCAGPRTKPVAETAITLKLNGRTALAQCRSAVPSPPEPQCCRLRQPRQRWAGRCRSSPHAPCTPSPRLTAWGDCLRRNFATPWEPMASKSDSDAGNGQEKGNPLAAALLCRGESGEIRPFFSHYLGSDPRLM